jgi:hypothetical protein
VAKPLQTTETTNKLSFSVVPSNARPSYVLLFSIVTFTCTTNSIETQQAGGDTNKWLLMPLTTPVKKHIRLALLHSKEKDASASSKEPNLEFPIAHQ